MPRLRIFHWRACSKCGSEINTSCHKAAYICASCRRAMGFKGAGRCGEGFTALTVPPIQNITCGTCSTCKRDNQELANGLCSCCRFYKIQDIDPLLSENGRKGSGGINDWVKRLR